MTPDPPAGARCFLDANIFVYYFVRNALFSPACWDLLQRVEAGELTACTSPMMISEALHRIMLSEVQTKFSKAKPLAYVQGHRQVISQLAGYHAACVGMSRLKLEILSIDAQIFGATWAVAAQHTLMTDDASTLALMRREGIGYLATNDDDFRDVPGITVCKPL
jgi:predicted nucleic acid-binding protein